MAKCGIECSMQNKKGAAASCCKKGEDQNELCRDWFNNYL